MTAPTPDSNYPEKTIASPSVFASTEVPKAYSPPSTPLEAARGIIAEQYLAAQDREDQGRTLLKAAEDHHAKCVDELNLLEDAHRAVFPEQNAAPVDPAPVAGAVAPHR